MDMKLLWLLLSISAATFFRFW